MQSIIKITDGVARQEKYRLSAPINFSLDSGEHIAIVGRNGAGKSLLVGVLTGEYPLYKNDVEYDFTPSTLKMAYENIKHITFRDSYGETDGAYYYQQRWNSQDREESPKICDLLPQTDNIELKNRLFDLFQIEKMLDKQIVLLSSGELRKFQLTKVLLSNPRVLIMDNPFIGLDVTTRDQLRNLLEELISISTISIILVFSKVDEIPTFITHVVEVKDGVCGDKIEVSNFEIETISDEMVQLPTERAELIQNIESKKAISDSSSVVEMNNVSIRYGNHSILNEISWNINRGEHWALSGDNGAGKSTLLSLVCADNPQSYACNITLFGRKRGSGESIWDIKKRIGYVSPEMHRSYLTSLPAIDIVASGLYDTIGLFECTNPKQIETSTLWMKIFGIDHLKARNFMQLSSGEQRLVLLARAFVKDPELLVLDEPFHGLDNYNRLIVGQIIEQFCLRRGKTMIIVSHYADELPKSITNKFHLTKR